MTERTFQDRVAPWMQECFGAEISADTTERNHRFLEEALELVQSTGCTQEEAHQLVGYVFNREVGDPPQEVGGVMVTLAALCLAADLDMHECGETELARIWTKIDKIRAKQAAKPKHSPLPQKVERQYSEIEVRAIRVAALREAAEKLVERAKLYEDEPEAWQALHVEAAYILAMIDPPVEDALNAMIGAILQRVMDDVRSFRVHFAWGPKATLEDAQKMTAESYIRAVEAACSPADALAALERVKQAERERWVPLLEDALDELKSWLAAEDSLDRSGFSMGETPYLVLRIAAAIRGESDE